MIARTAGRLAGRAIGYVQMARGHFENVLQQSQASQVFLLFYSLDCFLFSPHDSIVESFDILKHYIFLYIS